MLPYAFRNDSATAQLMSSLQQLLYRGNGSYGSLPGLARVPVWKIVMNDRKWRDQAANHPGSPCGHRALYFAIGVECGPK